MSDAQQDSRPATVGELREVRTYLFERMDRVADSAVDRAKREVYGEVMAFVLKALLLLASTTILVMIGHFWWKP